MPTVGTDLRDQADTGRPRSVKSSRWTSSPDVGSGRTDQGRVSPCHTTVPSGPSTTKSAGSAESSTQVACLGAAGR